MRRRKENQSIEVLVLDMVGGIVVSLRKGPVVLYAHDRCVSLRDGPRGASHPDRILAPLVTEDGRPSMDQKWSEGAPPVSQSPGLQVCFSFLGQCRRVGMNSSLQACANAPADRPSSRTVKGCTLKLKTPQIQIAQQLKLWAEPFKSLCRDFFQLNRDHLAKLIFEPP